MHIHSLKEFSQKCVQLDYFKIELEVSNKIHAMTTLTCVNLHFIIKSNYLMNRSQDNFKYQISDQAWEIKVANTTVELC